MSEHKPEHRSHIQVIRDRARELMDGFARVTLVTGDVSKGWLEAGYQGVTVIGTGYVRRTYPYRHITSIEPLEGEWIHG